MDKFNGYYCHDSSPSKRATVIPLITSHHSQKEPLLRFLVMADRESDSEEEVNIVSHPSEDDPPPLAPASKPAQDANRLGPGAGCRPKGQAATIMIDIYV